MISSTYYSNPLKDIIKESLSLNLYNLEVIARKITVLRVRVLHGPGPSRRIRDDFFNGLGRKKKRDFSNGPGWAGKREVIFFFQRAGQGWQKRNKLSNGSDQKISKKHPQQKNALIMPKKVNRSVLKLLKPKRSGPKTKKMAGLGPGQNFVLYFGPVSGRTFYLSFECPGQSF